MVDEIFDRHYQEARTQLHATVTDALTGAAQGIRDAFEVLVGIEYQSPWTASARKAKCN